MDGPPGRVEIVPPLNLGNTADTVTEVHLVIPSCTMLSSVPSLEGPLQELSINKLSSKVDWLLDAVGKLQGGQSDTNTYIEKIDADARLECLEYLMHQMNENFANLLTRLDCLEHKVDVQEAMLLDRLSKLEALVNDKLGIVPEKGVDNSDELARLAQSLADLEKKVAGIKIPKQLDLKAALDPIYRRLEALEARPQYPEPKFYDDELDDIRRRLDALEARKDPEPVVVREEAPKEEEPKKRKPGTRPIVLSKPLEVSRDFLDLKNHRHLQDLGQEHAGLKAALSAFEVAIINETSRLGTYMISVRNEFEQELNKFKAEMEVELNLRPTWEQLYAHEAPRIAYEDAKFAEIALDLNEHIRRIDLTDVNLSEFADETRAIDKAQDIFAKDLSTRLDETTIELTARFNALDGKLRKGPVTMESITRIDVVEEIKRLRHMIETGGMFGKDPLAMGTNGTTNGLTNGPTNGIGQAGVRSAELEVLVQEQQRNTTSLLRGFERDIARVNSKVDDVQKLLRPLQPQKLGAPADYSKEVAWVLVGNDGKASPEDNVAHGPPPADQTALVGLVQRSDLIEAELKRVRGELENSLASKAEVSALAGRLDAWVSSPPVHTAHGLDEGWNYDAEREMLPALDSNQLARPWAKKTSPPRERKGGPPPGADKPKWYNGSTVSAARHDSCARPTCPSSIKAVQSTGRLPESRPATDVT